MRTPLERAKTWLRIDHDHDDEMIILLIHAAQQYVLNACGLRSIRQFGQHEELAWTFVLYLISHWYEDRDFYNPSPQSVKKPMLTMMMTQLQNADYSRPTGCGGNGSTLSHLEEAEAEARKERHLGERQ